MAQDSIVGGLFGLTPWEARNKQMSRYDELANAEFQAAAGTPGQLMARAYGGMGANLGGMLGESMGMQDPAVAQAQMEQSALSGLNPSNPQAILERASQIQDPRLKMKLTLLAQELAAKQRADSLKEAQESLTLARAANEWTKEQREKYSTFGQQLIDAGYKPGSPEFQAQMKRFIDADITGKTKSTSTNITIGAEKPIEIPKFRDQVQQTVKPYLQTVDAADSSEAMIEQAIKTGNPNSFQGARVQLAKAFGDSQITSKEIQAAGGDPSIWGGLKDSTSVLFTGTPSVETMNAVKRTVQALRKVAKAKGRNELDVQKRMGIRAGLNEKDVNDFLTFEQFKDNNSAPVTTTKTLSSGKKVTVTVSQ